MSYDLCLLPQAKKPYYIENIRTNVSVRLAVIETEAEQEHYDAEEYDALFRDSGYDDEDIFYYIRKN